MSLSECHPVSRAVRSAEPTVEPVTVDEARAQCSLGQNTAHDELLSGIIVAARQQVEQDTGLVAYTGTFTEKMTEWPWGDVFELGEVRPVTAITSITYVDGDGTTQTLSTSVYAFESSGVKQFVRLKYGQTWPAIRGDINGITVTFVAGHASRAAIPQRFKQAVLLLVNHWFENRGVVGSGGELPLAYQALINSLGRKTYP